MSEDVSVDDLVKPQPDDLMTNHAEQHSLITDLIVAKDKLQQEIEARVESGETIQETLQEAIEGKAAADHTHDAPDLTHDHDDEYASRGELSEVKGDIESLELGLELLATTLEAGVWINVASPGVRPGQMWLAFNDFTVQQNQLIISNEDANGKTHGWVNLHEGDYVEMLDRSETTERTVENDYGLFMVTSVDKGDGITTIELDLHSGQGQADADELFEVRVLNIAESELDMASLDARYLKNSGTQTVDSGRWLLKAPKSDGSGNYSYIDITGNDEMGLYHVKYPENSVHAANMQYVDDEVGKIATEITNKSDSTHDHNSSYAPKDHEHPNTMKTGTSTNPSLARGELYLNTNNKVVYVGY